MVVKVSGHPGCIAPLVGVLPRSAEVTGSIPSQTFKKTTLASWFPECLLHQATPMSDSDHGHPTSSWDPTLQKEPLNGSTCLTLLFFKHLGNARTICAQTRRARWACLQELPSLRHLPHLPCACRTTSSWLPSLLRARLACPLPLRILPLTAAVLFSTLLPSVCLLSFWCFSLKC